MSLERRLAALERHNAELLRRLDRLPVRFAAGGGGGGLLRRARLTADLAWEGSATAVYRTGAPGSVVDGTATITVYDDLLNTGDDPLLSGSKVWIAFLDGYWWVFAVSCPAS